MSACIQNCQVIQLDGLSEREKEGCAAYCKAKAALRQFFRFDSFVERSQVYPYLWSRQRGARDPVSRRLRLATQRLWARDVSSDVPFELRS